MYISPKAVDEMLAFVVNNSGTGSSVLFDYFLQSVVDGTCEIGKNIQDFVKQVESLCYSASKRGLRKRSWQIGDFRESRT